MSEKGRIAFSSSNLAVCKIKAHAFVRSREKDNRRGNRKSLDFMLQWFESTFSEASSKFFSQIVRDLLFDFVSFVSSAIIFSGKKKINRGDWNPRNELLINSLLFYLLGLSRLGSRSLFPTTSYREISLVIQHRFNLCEIIINVTHVTWDEIG